MSQYLALIHNEETNRRPIENIDDQGDLPLDDTTEEIEDDPTEETPATEEITELDDIEDYSMSDYDNWFDLAPSARIFVLDLHREPITHQRRRQLKRHLTTETDGTERGRIRYEINQLGLHNSPLSWKATTKERKGWGRHPGRIERTSRQRIPDHWQIAKDLPPHYLHDRVSMVRRAIHLANHLRHIID